MAELRFKTHLPSLERVPLASWPGLGLGRNKGGTRGPLTVKGRRCTFRTLAVSASLKVSLAACLPHPSPRALLLALVQGKPTCSRTLSQDLSPGRAQ